jgi:hypothetical protein
MIYYILRLINTTYDMNLVASREDVAWNDCVAHSKLQSFSWNGIFMKLNSSTSKNVLFRS